LVTEQLAELRAIGTPDRELQSFLNVTPRSTRAVRNRAFPSDSTFYGDALPRIHGRLDRSPSMLTREFGNPFMSPAESAAFPTDAGP
jgi:hypothetical protein